MADQGNFAADSAAYDSGDTAETSTLFAVIDRDKVFGLNLTVPEDAREVIKPWNERESVEKWIDSGVDDQLIIHIPFTQNVKVRSLLIKPARGEACPHRLRIYSNRPHGIDFDEAESTKPHLDMSLLENEHGVTEYPLRVAAFANVNSLTLFFSESPAEESSRIYYLGFRGDTREARKEMSSKLDIAAANAADAPVTKVAGTNAASQTTIR